MYVIGMERRNTQPFVVACNKFKYLEALAKDEAMDDPLDTVVTSPEVVRRQYVKLLMKYLTRTYGIH